MKAVLLKVKTPLNSSSGEITLRARCVTLPDNPILSFHYASDDLWWRRQAEGGLVFRDGCREPQQMLVYGSPSSDGHTLRGGSNWLCFPFVLPVATNKPFHSAGWKDAVAKPMSFHTQAAIVPKRKLITLILSWIYFVSVPLSIHTSQECFCVVSDDCFFLLRFSGKIAG